MTETAILPRARKASHSRTVWVHLLLAAAYVATGRLGLFLAVPPGYASAIFPPAGIAAAAALIGGSAMLPAVFLGSLLLNVITAGVAAPAAALAGACIIAAASTLQAAIVGAALRRLIGYPVALDNSRDLLCFLALAPACCLTSSTLSLAGLGALGVVQTSALAVNWVTWWVGDTLGVLVVLPLMLVLAGEPRALWRRRTYPVALPMLAFFGFFIAVFVRVSAWENDQTLLEFKLLSQQAVDRVHNRLEEQEILLGQLRADLSRPTPLSRAAFAELVRGALQRFPPIQAIGWAPRVADGQRAAFEAAQQEAAPRFRIEAIGRDGALRPAASAPVYYPVAFVEPLAANRWALGLDMMSDAERRAAVTEALAGGAAVASPPLRAPTGAGHPGGVLLLLPVRAGGDGSGLVLIKFSVAAFVADLPPALRSRLILRLVDLGGDQTLYDGFPTARTPIAYRQRFEFGRRHYELQAAPSPLYLQGHLRWQSWALLAVGVLGTGLLGALLMLGTGYAHRIERQVERRTGELAAANRQLQIEMEERRQAEAALRHAQRLEALGQLTGGIAHDFNNLLTVIGANAEMLRSKADDEAGQRRVDKILLAAERGERMTRQLLAFSRRSTLRPEVVDLRRQVGELAEMLAQSMHEQIEVAMALPEDLWPVSIDPAEFELALLNIAVNARDAMPAGGRLHVGASNVTISAGAFGVDGPQGDMVALALADSGTGMPPDILARAFEPYFTTKRVGAGSGLGLSQVYGFATQSGGHATITSEPGAGTTVTLYLPRAVEPPAVATAPAIGLSGTRFLVVEDVAEIGDLTMSMLRELGHDAVHVRDVPSALEMLSQDGRIGMVITDIAMPGPADGLDLARTVRAQYPELPLLLVTGFSRSAQAAAQEGFVLLEKPFRRESLEKAIRVAIENRAHPAPDTSGVAAG